MKILLNESNNLLTASTSSVLLNSKNSSTFNGSVAKVSFDLTTEINKAIYNSFTEKWYQVSANESSVESNYSPLYLASSDYIVLSIDKNLSIDFSYFRCVDNKLLVKLDCFVKFL